MQTAQAPSVPNPFKTADAQTQSNTQTALTQAILNMTNQKDPYGSTLNYSQTGSYNIKQPIYDKNGNVKGYRDQSIPQFTATTTLSPEQQAIANQQQQFDKEWNQLALDQTGKLQNILNTPVDLSNPAVEDRIAELQRARLDPMWNDKQAQMETSLRNKGLEPGSVAYDRAMRDFNQGRNDSYNQMFLTGRQQALNELLQQRNQPINEISTLMNGGQVQLPNWVNTPNTGVQGTNVAGLVGDAYAANYANYQNKVNQNNAFLGGLAGLGGAALSSPWMGGWFGG